MATAPGQEGSVSVPFVGDTAQFESAVKRAGESIKEFETRTRVAFMGITKDTEKGTKSLEDYLSTMHGGIGTVTSFAAQMTSAVGIMGGVTGALAAIGMAGVNYAKGLDDAADATGLSAAEVVKFNRAARDAGVGADSLANMVSVLNAKMGDAQSGNEAAIKTFDDLGLNYKKLAEMSVAERFVEVADAISRLDGVTKQTNATRDAFGRGGVKIVSGLGDMSASLRGMISETTEYDAALNSNVKTMDGIGNFFGAFFDEAGEKAMNFTATLANIPGALGRITGALPTPGGFKEEAKPKVNTGANDAELARLLKDKQYLAAHSAVQETMDKQTAATYEKEKAAAKAALDSVLANLAQRELSVMTELEREDAAYAKGVAAVSEKLKGITTEAANVERARLKEAHLAALAKMDEAAEKKYWTAEDKRSKDAQVAYDKEKALKEKSFADSTRIIEAKEKADNRFKQSTADSMAAIVEMEKKKSEYSQSLVAKEDERHASFILEKDARTKQAHNSLIERQTVANEAIAGLQTDHEQRIATLTDEYRASNAVNEQAAQDANTAMWQSGAEGKMNVLGGVLSQMSVLMESKNRQMFEVGKIAAIASTVINTIEAAMASYKSLSGIPIVGPALGAIAAATAVAAGMMRIQQLNATTFVQAG